MFESCALLCASLLQRVKVSGEFTIKPFISLAIRAFVNSNYAEIKATDPKLPFIVRECEGAQPCVTARYDFGVERKVYLHNCNSAEVG